MSLKTFALHPTTLEKCITVQLSSLKGLAYVDDQTAEEIAQTRGDVVTPGIPSPYRDRSIERKLKTL